LQQDKVLDTPAGCAASWCAVSGACLPVQLIHKRSVIIVGNAAFFPFFQKLAPGVERVAGVSVPGACNSISKIFDIICHPA